ncbi:MAG: hypothetical protein HY744_28860 [Deltaproteobacteria bacterium]|nr:hypothetical protein [Deltaproteobacteria bacterium]
MWPACVTAQGGAGDAGSGGAADGGSGVVPPCGDGPCAKDEYCDYAYQSCGAYVADVQEDYAGCHPRPTSCNTTVVHPACGCDGQRYPSPCEAYAAGVDLDRQGCASPGPEWFACGPLFCRRHAELCHIEAGDVGDWTWNCVGPTAMCAADPVCDCLVKLPCYEPSFLPSCKDDGQGGIVWLCAF